MDPLFILEQLGGPARDLAKALTGTRGAGTDLSTLTGAGALRVENLDPVLFSVTVENKHFSLFNKLLPHKRDTFSMLDQQTVKKGIGSFPGSAVSNELATGRPDRTGDYKRLLTELGQFTDFRQVGLVTALQGAMQQKAGAANFSTVAEENVNASLTILESVEWSLFNADRAVSPFEINGLIPGIKANAPGNVIDMGGDYFTDHTKLTDLAARICRKPWFGKPDMIYTSTGAKTDLDNCLVSGYRLNPEGVSNTEVGIPVVGMRYSAVGIGQGLMNIEPHAYIEEELIPVQAQNATLCSGAGPASVAGGTVAPGSTTGSLWKTGQDGNYHYVVEACRPGETSVAVVTASATAVAVGGSIDLTITQSADGKETHYNIYRGRKGGTNGLTDVRLVARVAKSGGATTVWRDLNAKIPGTSEIVMLTSAPQLGALTWVQMLPLTQYPLANVDLSMKWACLLLGALRVPEFRKHGLVTNYLPKTATWKPFA